jgi:hypothetical protein
MENMLEQLIRELQSLADSGEVYIDIRGLLKVAYSERRADEWDARERIIRNIVRAKRDAGFPLDSDFFRDVWPVVLKSYLEGNDPK